MSLSLSLTTSSTATSANPLRRSKPRPSVCRVGKRVALSCEQKQNTEGDGHVIDRRNVLLGFSGLCGAAATLGSQGMLAIGAPVQPPDLYKCHLAVDDEAKKQVNCCPPYSTANMVDFIPPSHYEPLRVRRPAHKLDAEYVAKFKEAIAKMKALPDDDPWSFMQQATIHCTYCNGAFDQVGFEPPVLLQVHGSWLFLPWHRFYLYFFERILGKLIGDPTFALPFWNWDTPEGMRMPSIYLPESPLNNHMRDKSHYKSVFDYKYAYGDPNPTQGQEEEVIIHNLRTLHKIFKESSRNPALFMGKALRAGQTVPTNASGGLENLHNTVHMWTGTNKSPYYDMGNFYTAARDTLFYAHHGNVDRMWDIYNGFRGNKPEFKDPDWLDAAFVFYDENRQVVKCKVRDCLTPQQLRYTYHPEELPWMSIHRRYMRLRAANKRTAGESEPLVKVSEFGSKTRALTEPIQAIIKRPKTYRSKNDKEEETEVLIIEGIEVPHATAARFDVYVAKPIDGLVGDKGELAGSFVKIPHTHHKLHLHLPGHKATLEMGITTLLEDIEAEDSETLVVTIVPRMGEVEIGGIHIEMFKVDED